MKIFYLLIIIIGINNEILADHKHAPVTKKTAESLLKDLFPGSSNSEFDLKKKLPLSHKAYALSAIVNVNQNGEVTKVFSHKNDNENQKYWLIISRDQKEFIKRIDEFFISPGGKVFHPRRGQMDREKYELSRTKIDSISTSNVLGSKLIQLNYFSFDRGAVSTLKRPPLPHDHGEYFKQCRINKNIICQVNLRSDDDNNGQTKWSKVYHILTPFEGEVPPYAGIGKKESKEITFLGKKESMKELKKFFTTQERIDLVKWKKPRIIHENTYHRQAIIEAKEGQNGNIQILETLASSPVLNKEATRDYLRFLEFKDNGKFLKVEKMDASNNTSNFYVVHKDIVQKEFSNYKEINFTFQSPQKKSIEQKCRIKKPSGQYIVCKERDLLGKIRFGVYYDMGGREFPQFRSFAIDPGEHKHPDHKH